MFMIAAVPLAQSGCALLVGRAAVGVGKKVYEKVKDDKAKNKPAKQE